MNNINSCQLKLFILSIQVCYVILKENWWVRYAHYLIININDDQQTYVNFHLNSYEFKANNGVIYTVIHTLH